MKRRGWITTALLAWLVCAPAAHAAPGSALVPAGGAAAGASSATSGSSAAPGTASAAPSAVPPGAPATAAPAATGAPATAAPATGNAPAAGTPDASGLPPVVDPNAPFVLMEDVFVLVPQGAAVRVQELVTGANRSGATVHGLTFALPPGAVGAEPASGIPAGAFSADGQGVHLRIDVPPGGDVHAAFTFTTSWAGGRQWLPVSYPTGELTVMVPHGRWAVSGPGFSAAGTLRLSGNVAVDVATTVTPSAGALVPVRLRPVTWWSGTWARVGLAAAAAATAAAGLAAHLRRRRSFRQRREAELIDALAELDLARQRGEVADSPYLDRRQRLLAELEALEVLHGG